MAKKTIEVSEGDHAYIKRGAKFGGASVFTGYHVTVFQINEDNQEQVFVRTDSGAVFGALLSELCILKSDCLDSDGTTKSFEVTTILTEKDFDLKLDAPKQWVTVLDEANHQHVGEFTYFCPIEYSRRQYLKFDITDRLPFVNPTNNDVFWCSPSKVRKLSKKEVRMLLFGNPDPTEATPTE